MVKKSTYTPEQNKLARYAKALGHPVRIAIVQMLLNEKCCYHGDMSELLPVAKSTLSQHLKELKEAGIIQGSFTPPTIKYCINAEEWVAVKALFMEMFESMDNMNRNNIDNCNF